MTRLPFAALPLAALLMGAAHAAPAKTVDPKAKAALQEMAAASRSLTSYAADLTVVSSGPNVPPNAESFFVFHRPSKAALDVITSFGLLRWRADGQFLYASLPVSRKHYLKIPLHGDGVAQTVIRAGNFLFLGGQFIDPKFAEKLIGTPMIQSVTMGDADTLGGVPVQKVILEGGQGDAHGRITLAIGTQDHLLRQILETNTGPKGASHLTVTYTQVHANPTLPANAFTFAPPAGQTPVRAFPLASPKK